jgi:putative membrane protein
MEEIAPVAEVTGFALPWSETEWRRPAGRDRFDQAWLLALPLALVAGAVGAVGFVLPALGVGALALLLALRQLFLWRYDRHALDARHIYVRHGWLAPQVDVGSRVKLQSIEIAQGPVARCGGYAHLIFGVAGGSLKIDGIALAEARALRAAVLESIAAVDFSRLSKDRAITSSQLPARS